MPCLKTYNFSIDAGVCVTVVTGLLEEIGVCSLSISHDGCQQLKSNAWNQGCELCGNLSCCLRLNGSTALGAMTRADTSEENAQVVVNSGESKK